jgi:hypothetical protein
MRKQENKATAPILSGCPTLQERAAARGGSNKEAGSPRSEPAFFAHTKRAKAVEAPPPHAPEASASPSQKM